MKNGRATSLPNVEYGGTYYYSVIAITVASLSSFLKNCTVPKGSTLTIPNQVLKARSRDSTS